MDYAHINMNIYTAQVLTAVYIKTTKTLIELLKTGFIRFNSKNFKVRAVIFRNVIEQSKHFRGQLPFRRHSWK